MNVYEIITQRILDRIEDAKISGKMFHWVKPWNGGAPFAVSYTTGNPYRGINRMLLDAGEYITFNALQDYRKTQPEDESIFVKQGSHKMPIFYYGTYEKKDTSGNPIYEVYEFIARDIVESDEPRDKFRYNDLNKEGTASSDVKYLYDNLYKK